MAEEKLVYQNFPFEEDEAIVREVAFGPVSEDFAVLIEFNPVEGPLRVTVGNGPDHVDAPGLVAITLRSVADSLDDLQVSDEYLAELAAHNNK